MRVADSYLPLALHAGGSHDMVFTRVVIVPLMHETHVQTVRQLVMQTFTELGSRSVAPPRETLLICDGNYFGRRFARDEFRAVWFIEENQLKFSGQDGLVMRTVQPFGRPGQEHSKAA